MKRSTPFFLLLLLLALFTGCQKETNEQLPVPAAARLEKITKGDELLQFSYNSDGSLKEALLNDALAAGGDRVTFRISYAAAGKIREVLTDDGRKIIPVYEDNKIIEALVQTLTGQPVARSEYTYLNGMLKSAALNVESGGLPVPWLKYIFTYDGRGNVLKTQLLVNDLLSNQLVPAGQVHYEYDNRANPLEPVKDFLLLIWQAVSPNNIKKETEFGPQNTVDETREYTYTYNSRNLPQNAQVTKTVPGQPAENLTMTFTYR